MSESQVCHSFLPKPISHFHVLSHHRHEMNIFISLDVPFCCSCGCFFIRHGALHCVTENYLCLYEWNNKKNEFVFCCSHTRMQFISNHLSWLVPAFDQSTLLTFCYDSISASPHHHIINVCLPFLIRKSTDRLRRIESNSIYERRFSLWGGGEGGGGWPQ